eukprot:m.179462 g.179462  ORF g.179462 m.179462 type:complete len:131 (+) comp18393_c1_seq2:250-642(+)
MCISDARMAWKSGRHDMSSFKTAASLDDDCNENSSSIHRFRALVKTVLSEKAHTSSHENALLLAKDQLRRQTVQCSIERSQLQHRLQTRLEFIKTKEQLGAVKAMNEATTVQRKGMLRAVMHGTNGTLQY